MTPGTTAHLPALPSTPHDARLCPLDLAVLLEPSPVVARALLGVCLVRDDDAGRRVVRIVESEAYMGPGDQASHARAGPTPRTAVMFGPAGRAYVYLVYGMHHCLNVVCGETGVASAVLIRAAEPLLGIDIMRARRGPAAGSDVRLAAGPGRLCQALDIDRGHTGVDLLHDDGLRLAVSPAFDRTAWPVAVGPRIGVAYAGPDWAGRPWRFGLAGHPSLSRPFPAARD